MSQRERERGGERAKTTHLNFSNGILRHLSLFFLSINFVNKFKSVAGHGTHYIFASPLLTELLHVALAGNPSQKQQGGNKSTRKMFPGRKSKHQATFSGYI